MAIQKNNSMGCVMQPEVDDGMLWFVVVVGGHSVWAGRVTCIIIMPFSESLSTCYASVHMLKRGIR